MTDHERDAIDYAYSAALDVLVEIQYGLRPLLEKIERSVSMTDRTHETVQAALNRLDPDSDMLRLLRMAHAKAKALLDGDEYPEEMHGIPAKVTDEAAKRIVFGDRWPEGLTPDENFEVMCDDSAPDSLLGVCIDGHGDAWAYMKELSVASKAVDLTDDLPRFSTFPSIRIRTHQGGGRKQKVRQALVWLAYAIQSDPHATPTPNPKIEAETMDLDDARDRIDEINQEIRDELNSVLPLNDATDEEINEAMDAVRKLQNEQKRLRGYVNTHPNTDE